MLANNEKTEFHKTRGAILYQFLNIVFDFENPSPYHCGPKGKPAEVSKNMIPSS